MRINLNSLDPGSPLARRVQAAFARDAVAKTTTTASAFGEHWRSEEDLHRAIVGMIAVEARTGVIAFHVPNGGRRGKAEAGRLKGMGTLAGVPDLIVIADGRAFGLEIKTEKGRLSKEQKIMRQRFARAGIEYEVARSVEEARAILQRWGVIESQMEIAA